jgi:D-beta-D-heptose 7-phosphate kinase/D-beta-D-heptose 1-phosphate adenosyltransferase
MKRLIDIINHFPSRKILVVGDLILDEYIWGDVERISPEAPVPVLWATRRTFVPGGAANVANNIRALEGDVCLIGVVGRDENAEVLFSELRKRKIPTKGIFVEPVRHTTVKTRIIAQHQQVVRVDWEHTHPLGQKINERIIKFVARRIADFDVVVIEDYGKGVINKLLLGELIALAKRHKKLITVDPKEENFQYYRGVTSITPNRKELENAIRNLRLQDTANRLNLVSDKLSTNRDIDLAARRILDYLDLDSLLVTLGEHGMQLCQKDGRITHIPTVAQEVFDVSGAGDTVIATFSLSLSCQASLIDSAHIANYAAGIVVGKVGTATTTRKELIEKIKRG